MDRILNIGLRGLTLVSKFILIFFLARFIEPAELGLYGLLTVTIGYALYLLGFDFYTFTTREILKRSRDQWGGLLKDQIALSLLLYAVFIPLLLLTFAFGLLPWSVAVWFFVLLVLEHINQELSRLLIAISEQLTASVVLLFRSGLWGIVITVWMFLDPDVRTLHHVLAAWTVGGVLALILGVTKLSTLNISGWHKRVDWQWIRKGLRIALPLLVGTLALRGIFTLDRYWFESLNGLDVLGAYVLYMGMTNALMSFLDAGVFAFKYPGLISAFHAKDDARFRHGMKTMFLQTVVLSVMFAVGAIFVVEPLLTWLDRPIYSQHLYLFYWLLVVMLLYAVGMVPHFGLYAQGSDQPLIRSHVVGVIVFVLVTLAFARLVPQLAVVIGLCASFGTILIWKAIAFQRSTPKQYRLI